MSDLILSSSIPKGFYPERKLQKESKLEQVVIGAIGNVKRWLLVRHKRFYSIVNRVNGLSTKFESMDEQEIRAKIDDLRMNLRAHGFRLDLVSQSFALVREIARRRINMRHFDVQLIGGFALLNRMVVEMETGEGKTLTATLPACTAALRGIPVHIITVNDYLAKRDADWMRPIYESFGLSVGVIIHGMSIEERRRAYHCDITYASNKEIVFDYLKDRLLFGRQPGQIQMRLERLHGGKARLDKLLLRGLSFAIVDEADSVMIDEARTPLIISGPIDNSYEVEVYRQAFNLSKELQENEDFSIDAKKNIVELTEKGKIGIKEKGQLFGGLWNSSLRREELVQQALTAQYLFTRDKDYIVRDNKIQIVDEYTGRTMADRSWERGLHQLLEVKEGCDITAQNETLVRISYQRFFRRYHHLAGMTGTAREVAGELWSVYRAYVISIPTNKKLIRRAMPFRIYPTKQEKWNEILKRIVHMHDEGRPVLAGSRSVATSEYLSTLLTEAGVPHRVLNARQDKNEAEIISQAGQKGQITIATNMAGRGTDIVLAQGVAELGGLHVIATEYHDAKRIDRQLFGRCGRQGDPGSFECIASLEDDIFKEYLRRPLGWIIRKWIDPHSVFGRWLGMKFISYVQNATQRKYSQIRRDLLKFDESLEDALSFSGRGE